MRKIQPEQENINSGAFISQMELASKSRLPVQHSEYFDMWRGGSALIVTVAHMIQVFAGAFPNPVRSVAAALAGAAVMVFFVISGFFIHKSIIQNWQDKLNWRRYIKSRVNRIYPPFIFSIAMTLCFYNLSPFYFATGSNYFINATDRAEFSLSGLLITIFHLNNFLGPTLSANGPLWSLAYEVWYYVIAILIALAVGGCRIGYIVLPVFLILSSLSFGFFIMGSIWLGGVILSLLHSRQKLPKLPSSVYLFVLSALVLVVIPFLSSINQSKVTFAFQFTFGLWMINHVNNILQRPALHSFRWLVYLSKSSYTLYVIHFPILLFCYGVLDSHHGVSMISALFSLFVAILFALLIGPRIERIVIFKK